MKRRITAIILSLCMMIVCSPICVQAAPDGKTADANPFNDITEANYFYKPVLWAVENGITKGTSAVRFSPNDACTRGQVVTFLWRAAGAPRVSGSIPFSDVPASAYYADAVKWAFQVGITGGTGNQRFSPNAVCNRGQIVTFLYRAAGVPTFSGGASYSDVSASAYYAKAVRWAASKGITAGTGNGCFSPNSACTRGQIVTFLYRAREIPLSAKGWYEAYRAFVTEYQFMSAGQSYTRNNDLVMAYLYDIDSDATPELVLTNGESGRATGWAYVYTYQNGRVVYLGIGPRDGVKNPADPVGLYGIYRDGSYLGVTEYTKDGTTLLTAARARYENFEGDFASYVKAMIYLNRWNLTQILTDGWDAFVNAG